MTLDTQLQDKAESLLANPDEQKAHLNLLQTVRDHLQGNEKYSIAKIWRTTPLSIESSVGQANRFDIMAVVHSSASERDLASIVQEQLHELSTSTIINKGVTIDVDGTPLHVTPTKFAQQGTIGKNMDDFPEFHRIVGQNKMFRLASALLQDWQHRQDLEIETQALLPFEIELTLAHIFNEYEPSSLSETLRLFFEYGKAERFATQLNIFDKHNNILLYHNFMIPEKQYFLEALFDAYDRWVTEDPDSSLFL